MLVLALLTVLSLALGAMFGNAGANLETSTLVASRNATGYAADAGVESAIQQLRANGSLCGVPAASATTMQPITINRRAVTVTCRTTAGSATSVSPWALITTDMTGNSLVSSPLPPGNSITSIITGPVSAAGTTGFQGPVEVDPSTPATTFTGMVQYSPSGCPPATPTGLTGPWRCTAAVQPPTPSPALPPSTFGTAPPPLSVTGTDCTIFFPGKYVRQTIAWTGHSYFASGVYYFEDTPLVLGGDVVGGGPGSDEVSTGSVTPAAPCANDQEGGIDNGTGVEFILGGNSRIEVGSHSMELYSRSPAGQPEGAAGVSIRTVSASDVGYKASTVGLNALDMQAGSHLAVHGMVYARASTVNLFATNSATPQTTRVADLLGGLVCSDLTIGPSAAGSSGQVISSQVGADPRDVVITSSAKASPTDLGITSTAAVSIGNDPARSVVVRSWITRNP